MNPDQRALQLAWDAYRAGSFPVGAVVLEGDRVVSEGQNRIFDPRPSDDALWSTLLAHAETNALSKLPVVHARPYRLVTTLEPCLLCTGAAYIARVAEIRYLASDPYGGAAHMEPVNPAMENAGMVVQGPVDSAEARLAGALPIVYLDERGLWPRTRAAFASSSAEPIARRLLTKGRLQEHIRPTESVTDLIEAIRHLLAREDSPDDP